jgi:hypothetical protein
MCVKPIRFTYGMRSAASSAYERKLACPSPAFRFHDPRCTS